MDEGDKGAALRERAVMDIVAAIAGRRSTREYRPEPVDEATIRRLISAATQAPNAVNQQPWTFAVIRDQALLDRLSREAKAYFLANMPVSPMPEVRAEHFRAALSDPAFQIFYHAPALILIAARAPGPWITEDCALAAENLMLMAHALGLGTCWIGFAQNYLNTAAGRQTLGLPPESVVVAPIILGHPRGREAAAARKDPEIRWVG
jgi:nitroreductase